MFSHLKPIIVLIATILSVAIIFLLILPQWEEAKSAKREVENTELQLKELKDRIEKFDSLNRKYTESADKKEVMDYIVPKAKEIPNLLVELQQLAIVNGVNMVSFSIGEGGGVKAQSPLAGEMKKVAGSSLQPGVVGIGLSIVGSYENFKKYLDAVEKNVRLIDINSVSFGAKGEEDVYSYSVSAEAYFLPRAE